MSNSIIAKTSTDDGVVPDVAADNHVNEHINEHKHTAKETEKHIVKKTARHIVKKTSERITKETSKQITKDTSEQITKETNKDAHKHLVCTGSYDIDKLKRLFVQPSGKNTGKHTCGVCSYDVGTQSVLRATGRSPETRIKEHGWVRDASIMHQIYGNHPTPNGSTSEEIFLRWRDTLLDFLDQNHHGTVNGITHNNPLWTRID